MFRLLDRFSDWLSRRFLGNPAAWILGGLLVFSVYSHYETSSEFSDVCVIVNSLEQGYSDFYVNQASPLPGLIVIGPEDDIWRRFELTREFLASGAFEAESYYWWQQDIRQASRICGRHMAEPDPYDEGW